MYDQLRSRANQWKLLRAAIVSTLLVVGSVGFTLLGGEAAARLAGYRGVEQYVPDDELGWILESGQATVTSVGRLPVTINAQGFRDDPLPSTKPPATIRIFALGASTTFGWGVRQDQTYHQVLERMLNDSARVAGYATRFEIVNAGVIGYNMWQVGRVMRRVAAGYQPDGVIVAYTFNDGWNQAGRLDTQERDRLRAGVRRKNLLRSSALFNWLTDFRAHRMARLAQRGGAADALAIAQTADTTASAAELAAYSATIDSIIRAAHELRLALAFVIPSVRGNPDVNQRQQVLIDGGSAAGLPLVRLGPAVGAEEQDSLYLPGDAVHPTPRGHALMARHIYAVLCDFAGRAAEADPARIYLAGCGAELHKRRL